MGPGMCMALGVEIGWEDRNKEGGHGWGWEGAGWGWGDQWGGMGVKLEGGWGQR